MWAMTDAPSACVCFVLTVEGARRASAAIALIFGDVMGSTPFAGGFGGAFAMVISPINSD